MPAKEPSPQERIQPAFKRLSDTAATLNAASDQLSAVISQLNSALQKLNIGISGWIKLSGGTNSANGEYSVRELGYARMGKMWGVTLRERSGQLGREEDEERETWPFQEAPRWLRLEAVSKIPNLIDHLVDQAESTAQRVVKKTEEARGLVQALNLSEEVEW